MCIFTGNADLILLRSNLYPLFCPIARLYCLELPFIVYSILKLCWSVGYVSLLTLSFICECFCDWNILYDENIKNRGEEKVTDTCSILDIFPNFQ